MTSKSSFGLISRILTYDTTLGGAQNFPLSVVIAQVEATPESAVFKSPLPRIDFVYLPNVSPTHAFG